MTNDPKSDDNSAIFKKKRNLNAAKDTYDELSRVRSVENPHNKIVSYNYDPVGRRSEMIEPDGGRFTYAYDDAGQNAWVLNPFNERTTFAYDDAGREHVTRLANGARASYAYDATGRVEKLHNLKDDGSPICSFDYQYDDVGNRTRVVEADGSIVTWSYDNTYQLLNEHRTGPTAFDVTHVYDPLGNRLVKVEDGTPTTYAYNPANQLKTALDSAGLTTFAYDPSGNLALTHEPTGDRTTNTWDSENRLILVQQPSNVNTMTYDADGLRTALSDASGASRFLWDQQNLLLTADDNGATQSLFTLQPRFYGNLLSQRLASASSFYQFDALGSAARLTDAGANVTDSYLYRAFGDLASASGATNNPFRFVGRLGYQFDPALAQYYIRARHYDPRLARWLSVDPLGFQIEPHLYIYGTNDPLNTTDPSGLWGIVAAGCGGGFIGSIVSNFPSFNPNNPNAKDWCELGTDLLCDTIVGCLIGALAQLNPSISTCLGAALAGGVAGAFSSGCRSIGRSQCGCPDPITWDGLKCSVIVGLASGLSGCIDAEKAGNLLAWLLGFNLNAYGGFCPN